ncbi:MAG: hypothetical protein PUC65_11460 [Clostridiales bacterium]|nr:hypothetical protein [Clostridiales bacterium]
MAQCILCNATIPDGAQYCENCNMKVRNKADESYLDNLLNSVTSLDDSQDNGKRRPPKKSKEQKEEKRKYMNDDIFDGVPNDYNIFSKSENDSDLDFLNDLFDHAVARAKGDDDNNSSLDSDENSLPEVATTDELSTIEPIIDSDLEHEPDALEVPEESDLGLEVPEESDLGPEVLEAPEELKVEPEAEKVAVALEPDLEAEEMALEPEFDSELAEVGSEAEQTIEDIPVEQELPVDDLMAIIEPEVNEDFETRVDKEMNVNNSPNSEQDSSTDEILDSDQDILDLINEINKTEEMPPMEEVAEHSNRLDIESQTEANHEEKHTSDIGDVFSDALSAVSTLKDKEEDPLIDEDLLSMIPDISEQVNSLDKDESLDNSSNSEKQIAKNKKQGFFARIFGNIREERTEEEIEQLKQKAIEEGEKKEAEKKAKEEQAKQKKEQAKLKKAEDAKKAKEEAAKKKQEKQQQAKAKKEEKAQRSREIQELIDEIDENEGRINKVGAGIVFALFAAVAIFIVVGTNIYSYSIAIKNATNNFEIQHYNEAYKNVYGIDIKDEDIEIYDKIMTVMFVNKQLNSYENYYNMKKYPEALDSLLKGLERYDKYYSLAGLLGIESDLDYVRNEILDKLNTTFDVSIEEANMLLSYEDQTEYSEALYNLLSERVQIKVDSEGNRIE